jgi:hypothetical protein
MCRGLVLDWALGGSVALCACGGGPKHVAPPSTATVTVAPTAAAPAPTAATPAGSDHEFPSARAACERMSRLEAEAQAGEGLVAPFCFDPAIFGASGEDQGRWLLWADSVERKTEGGMEFLSQRWSVLWVYPDGRTLQGPEFLSTQSLAFEDQKDVPQIVTLRNLFDYDGDGRPELLLPVRQYEHASDGSRRLWVLTVADDGRITEYCPELTNPVWAEDVDGDERPDLMLDPDNTLMDSEYPRHTSLMPEGWRLAHSLPDGTFSTSDAVATSFVGSAAELTRP